MTKAIYAAACSLVQAESGEEEMLRNLCVCASARLSAQLREDVSAEQIAESFICAAAMLAAADLLLCRADGGVKSFSAGPVSISQESCEQASRLQAQAEKLLAPWSKDSFRFMGVRA